MPTDSAVRTLCPATGVGSRRSKPDSKPTIPHILSGFHAGGGTLGAGYLTKISCGFPIIEPSKMVSWHGRYQVEASPLGVMEIKGMGNAYRGDRNGDARTLARWRNNFRAAWPNLTPLGFDDRLPRLWEYCLACCEAASLPGNIGVRQVVFAGSR